LPKQRLDLLLVAKNLCDSRQQAQRLIRAGEVKVNHQIIDKPATEIDPEAAIEVKQKLPYLSRGGEKLAKALELFAIDVCDRICLDGGISTGGFTDCLLQKGAKRVYGVDVGYGQVAWSFRYLTPEKLYGQEKPADLAVMDLSFISLTKVLPTLWTLLNPPREAILLVKPQFEVGREKVGKKGVVRDHQDQAGAIFQVLQAAEVLGWFYRGLTWSPITGPAGNVEYLLWLSTDIGQVSPSLAAIAEITQEAIEQF
jgi:23S rRNA (cytidine1920-2'-O)/16S rRNA (cytidine1409-2'-O)-methyltransferase